MAATGGKCCIFAFLLVISIVNCNNIFKSSLVFVIDSTGSMANEIREVKDHAKSIFDTVLHSRLSQIENFVLVTFNDPGISPAIVTRNANEFKWALDSIRVGGGGDCPEYSLSGIERALQKSLPRSYIFVFTDATAKDTYKFHQVKSLAQEKMSKIIFVLTGTCKGLDSDAYPRLAASTSGNVFTLGKTNINEILEFVKETAKGRETELAKGNFPPGPDHKLIYAVDDYVQTVLITVLGVWPSIFVTGPDGHVPDTTKIVNKPDVAVVKVNGNKTGIYTAVIGSASNTSVVVTGRTTIDFQHGFSTSMRTSLEGTASQPQPDVKSFLSIYLSVMEGGEVTLTEVKLLDLNNKVLLHRPLHVSKHNKQFYVTDSIETPKQSFRILISGYAVADHAHIERMAPTPIEPKSTPPHIILDNNKTKYTALVGDVVLRIPCKAIGYPEPAIMWKFGGKTIMSGSQYKIVENALLIQSPSMNDNGIYTCIANNYLGQDMKEFNGVVEKEITSYVDPHDIHILNGTSKRINCLLPHTNSDRIKWFMNGDILNTSEPYIDISNADVTKDGNYSCRISNEHGTRMETYVLDVGFPPTIKSYHDGAPLDWDGEGVLDCVSNAKPEATIEWFYEGKPLVAHHDVGQINITGWGQYSCKVTNVHGSVQRNFQVTSTDCLIHKTSVFHPKNPVLVTESRKWPEHKTKKDYIIIPRQEKIILSCQSGDMSNSFETLASTHEVEAECVREDTFSVNGKNYKYSDFHCKHEVTPFINRTGEHCYNATGTEIIQIGFKVKEFMEVYRVCLDVVNQVPLHSALRNINSNDIIPQGERWHTAPQFGSGNNEYDTCKDASSKCCIAKEQLVASGDVPLGAPQRITYYNQLNSILEWRPCDVSRLTWSSISKGIMRQAADGDAMGVWSGASEYYITDGTKMATYLWKVIKFDEVESLAIIYVNDPSPKDNQVRCKNVCAPGSGSWFNSQDKYTYCCSLSDFITAFNIPEHVFKK